jgi:hypothetical protein
MAGSSWINIQAGPRSPVGACRARRKPPRLWWALQPRTYPRYVQLCFKIICKSQLHHVFTASYETSGRLLRKSPANPLGALYVPTASLAAPVAARPDSSRCGTFGTTNYRALPRIITSGPKPARQGRATT